MRVVHDITTVHTTHPFVIARGGTSEHRLVRVRLIDDDGVEGWGEASPNRYYKETPETAVAALQQLAPIVTRSDPWHIEDIEADMQRLVPGNGSIKSAISAALHDLAGKRLGVPVYQLLGLNPERAPRSSFTIAIAATREELVSRVRAAEPYPILKVKLGTDRDEEIIRTVRNAAPDKILRVDANAAWTPQHAIEMIALLRDLGVEYVEQPVDPGDIEGQRVVHERAGLPVIADESCVVSTDVPLLAGRASGINIKLSKCGGIREALTMIATARAHGMLVMAGCMIETSLGISAAAHFAPLLDYADFDGAALLADDPYVGATIERGEIRLPDRPGLGVTPRVTSSPSD
jgi:L-alanine-DL-glutamate epimerase-like enolase superfamily enzyme